MHASLSRVLKSLVGMAYVCQVARLRVTGLSFFRRICMLGLTKQATQGDPHYECSNVRVRPFELTSLPLSILFVSGSEKV